jgi:hypothetical protein
VSLPWRSVSSGTLVLNTVRCNKHGAYSERPTIPLVEQINGPGTNNNLVMSPDGARNQEKLCWRRPAAIYCSALITKFSILELILRFPYDCNLYLFSCEVISDICRAYKERNHLREKLIVYGWILLHWILKNDAVRAYIELNYFRFGILTAVTMKRMIWDTLRHTPQDSTRILDSNC